MSYELFRNDVLINLSDNNIPDEQIIPAINAVDRAATNYEFERKSVSLIVANGVPEALKLYLVAKASENVGKKTLDNYFYTMEKFFLALHKPIDQVTANDIRVYLYDYKLRRGVTDRTLEQIRICINGFFDWCCREDILERNPCAKVNHIKYYSKPREALNMLEVEAMRLVCRTMREKAMLDTLCATGCRVTELCDIKKQDINWADRSVKIPHGKGNKFRVTFINAKAALSLKLYLSLRNDDCEYVFVNERGIKKHQIDKKTVETVIKRLAVNAGINRKITPHHLRHTFATNMIRNGAPVEHVQKLLGHAKLDTTMIYARVNNDDISQTYKRCAM